MALSAIVATTGMRIPPAHAAGLSISISGNHFIDGSGNTIRLLGVNRSGSEYMCTGGGSLVFDGPSDDASVTAMGTWDINVVRVPLNEDCWLGINGLPASMTSTTYQQAIVNYVNLLHAHGMYAILELHWNAPGSQQSLGQQVMVDADHGPTFWSSVATTFKADPAVLFDLYNEPQGISWACLRDGCVSGFQTVGMQSLVNTVRATGAPQPIMVGGLGYAGDLSQWLSYRPTDSQLAASFHTYDFVGNCNSLSCASTLVGITTAGIPVVTGELGETDCGHSYIDMYMPWADTNGISYLGWAWDTYGCSFPGLISAYDGTPSSTFGLGFKNHLLSLATTHPTVTGISPSTGPTVGGTSVTITGTNFVGVTAVRFGATGAASYTVNGPTQITATSPAGSGTVDVTVTASGSTSATGSADRFSYFASPPAPTGVTVTAAGTDGAVNVSWTAPAGTVTGYAVTAYDGCTIQGSQSVSGSPPATTLKFTGLTNGVAYTFKVAATNSSGTGPQSAASNVVVPSGSTAPGWLSACSPRQYSLSGSDGSSWSDLDAGNLALGFTPAATGFAVITANVDLWTANAGYNQDVGINVNGQIAAWKESGGFAGTFSPNAATVQTVIPVTAATAYSVKLQWKANKPDAGSIFAGAGPIGSAFSPTRLTVQLIPTSAGRVFTTQGTVQYALSGSDGATWQDVDATDLSLPFTVPAGSWTAYVFGNADLWTANPGYNQDLAINVGGTVAAWKESGGFAGTFSPNAAFVQAPLALGAGSYVAKLQWKANKPDPGTIFAGAGPIGGQFSPTRLTVLLVAGSTSASSTQQYSLANSNGSTWQSMDPTNLGLSLSPASDTNYKVSAGADLWTSAAGYNQDLGIMVSGGAYGAGVLVAWKESGGFAGTFSPNAAFVTTDLHLQAGNTYRVWLVWKTNRPAAPGAAIWSGAGPIAAQFSPTSLTACSS